MHPTSTLFALLFAAAATTAAPAGPLPNVGALASPAGTVLGAVEEQVPPALSKVTETLDKDEKDDEDDEATTAIPTGTATKANAAPAPEKDSGKSGLSGLTGILGGLTGGLGGLRK